MIHCRNDILADTARSLENSCHSMCTTPTGYKSRIKGVTEGVKLIPGLTVMNEGSDDMEDAVEVVEAVGKVSGERRKNGKAKAR